MKENKFYLEVDSTQYEIIEPIGFDQLTIKFERDIDLSGFNTEFVDSDFSLSFDCNVDNTNQFPAYNIIRDVYEHDDSILLNSPMNDSQQAQGSDYEIFFIWKEKDCLTSIETEIFKGRLDLETYVRDFDTVNCSIMRVSFEDKIRTRFNTQINLSSNENLDGDSITPLTPQVIELHSKKIQKEFNSIYTQDENVSITDNDIDNDGITTQYLQLNFGNDSKEQVNEIDYLEIPFAFNSSEPVFIYKVKEQGEHVFNYRFVFRFVITSQNDSAQNITNSYNIILKTPLSTYNLQTDSFNDFDAIVTFNTGIVDINGTLSESLLVDDEVKIYVVLGGQTAGASNFQTEFDCDINTNTSFQIIAKTEILPSNSNQYLIYETIEHIVKAQTGFSDRLRSDFFGRTDSIPRAYFKDGEGSLNSLTNGYQIRQFPINERPVFVKMSELFDSLNSCYNLGISFEKDEDNEVLRIEKREYFFKNISTLEIGNVSDNITYQTAKEFLFNEVQIGFSEWDDEKFNNIDEFNTLREYLTPLKSSKKELKKISKFSASGYLIEFLRREPYLNFSTKTNEHDKDNFFVQLRRNGLNLETEKDEPFDNVQNVFDPSSSYNLRLSPARNFTRHGNFLRSCLYWKRDVEKIKFTFGEGNYDLITDFKNTEVNEFINELQENQDFLLSLFDSYFVPFWVNIETNLSLAQIVEIKNNPYGLISFTDNEKKREGWLYELVYNSISTKTKIKLLLKEV